jgi:transposase
MLDTETSSPSLFSELVSLRMQLASTAALLAQRDEKLRLYEEEISWLHENLQELKRHRFGTKSERWETEEQLLFNEAEVYSQDGEDEEGDEAEAAESVEVKPHTRKRGHRKPLPAELPRRVVEITLPESERMGPDGKPLGVIGREVSEKLIYEPAKTEVIEYHRLRYGTDSGDRGVIAPPVPSIIPKGIATPELLAAIVTKKFAFGLPFYRQEYIFGRMGVEIPRCTQARWVVKAAEQCRPLWNILEEWLMGSAYVSCDETWTQVLKEKGKTAESKSWMWVRCTPSEIKKIVLFDYDPHRSAEVAKRLFSDYQGTLQVDGYASYNCLETQDGLIRIGCNMHGRRGFEKAHKTGAKTGKTLAEVGLKLYKRLYDIEEEARHLSFEERHKLRQEKAVPIWQEFKTWAEANRAKVPPKSKIGEAFSYFINEYPYLIGYLKAGHLEMDNGFAERAIKNFAIGRKNWMFSDTEAGAEASALFYSLVVTIKINGGDPYTVLKEIFTKIPLAKTIEDFERLAALIVPSRPKFE